MVEWLAARHWGLRTGFAVVAGILTALGFQPYDWWPLTILGVAGLSLTVLAARRLRGAIGLGYAYGIGFMLLGVGWMQAIFVQAMVALVLIEAAWYAGLAALIRIAGRTRWWPLLAAGSWVVVEFCFSRFPFNGFGWTRLAYAMVDSPLAWVLPLAGVPGLSLLTALIGQGVAALAAAPSRGRMVASAAVLAAIALLAAAGTLVPVGTQTGTSTVGYVQGGAPGGGVYGIGEARTTTRNHLAEAQRLQARVNAGELQKPEFVVLPENTTDMDPYTDAETGRLVDQLSATLGVPMLFGTILDGPGADERQTASLWWDPTHGELARYIKRGIVPFGEFVPLRSVLLPLIPELKFVGAQSVAGTAPGALPVTLPDGRSLTLGVLVCYDLVYDDFVHDIVTHGGQLLVVQSSNAMYQGTGQIEQQFAITRARALELRREILVVTTSGGLRPDQRRRIGRLHAARPRRRVRRGDAARARGPDSGRGLGRLDRTRSGHRDARRSRRVRDLRQNGSAEERKAATMTDPAAPLGRVLVIIPTYNEAENIGPITGRIRTAVPEAHILIADDNSPDGTGKLADALAAADDHIHVLHRTGKEGLGAAYIAGFRWGLDAGYGVLVEHDADGSHQPEYLPEMLARLQTADAVKGSRYVPGGATEGWPVHRELLSRGGNLWTRLMLGLSVKDATGGFTAWRAGTLRGIDLAGVEAAGYGFQVDLVWRALRAGFVVAEVPITFIERERGNSKMSGAIVAEAMLLTTRWGLKYRAGQVRALVSRLTGRTAAGAQK